MFFKKEIKVNIDSFGMFEWYEDFWYGEKNYLGKNIQLCVNGNKEAPDESSVVNLKKQFNILALNIKLAEEYIRSYDKTNITDYKKKYGVFKISALFLKSELGSFSLLFGSTKDDAEFIDVRFKYGKPHELFLGDQDEFDENFDDDKELEIDEENIQKCNYCDVVKKVCFWGKRTKYKPWKRLFMFITSLIIILFVLVLFLGSIGQPNGWKSLLFGVPMLLITVPVLLVSINGCNSCVVLLFGDGV